MSKLITNTIRHTGASVDALTFDANGNTLIADSEELQIGTDADLKIYHNGSHAFMANSTGKLFLRSDSMVEIQDAGGNESLAVFNDNGAVDLYYDSSLKARTYADGLEVRGDFWIDNQTNTGKDVWFDESSNTFRYYDDVKATFGTGNDLQIYHSGDHSYIKNTHASGYTHLQVNDGDAGIKIIPSGAVELYHNDNKRFETTTEGCKIPTGNGLSIFGGTGARTDDAVLFTQKGNHNDWNCYHNAYSGSSSDYGVYVRTGGSASYAYGLYDATNGAWRFRVQGDGTIYASSTTISSISDRRLKENIVDANSQWDDIKALRWRNFTWKNDKTITKPQLGLIADEVEPISPNLVEIDAQPKEDIEAEIPDPEYKGIKYSIVWMKAMKALQEAMIRIETLEAEVATLKGG